MIDWSQLVTEAVAQRVVISRRQGLFWLVDACGVTEQDIEAQIAGIENEVARYKAGVAFRSDTWFSDDEFIQALSAPLGLDTPEKLREAFCAAQML